MRTVRNRESRQYDTKRPCHSAGPFDSLRTCCWSERLYVGRTWAFFALSDLVFDLLAFIERCIARRLNFRVVDKEVIAAIIRGNKTKPLS